MASSNLLRKQAIKRHLPPLIDRELLDAQELIPPSGIWAWGCEALSFGFRGFEGSFRLGQCSLILWFKVVQRSWRERVLSSSPSLNKAMSSHQRLNRVTIHTASHLPKGLSTAQNSWPPRKSKPLAKPSEALEKPLRTPKARLSKPRRQPELSPPTLSAARAGWCELSWERFEGFLGVLQWLLG